MSGPFKLKYKNSAFPFKEDDKKKKEEENTTKKFKEFQQKIKKENRTKEINKIKEQIRQIEHLQLKRLEYEETKKNLIA